MLDSDPERVKKNAQKATTADLLDRVTVYREGMEPEALEIIEAELLARGVDQQAIAEHNRRTRQEAIMLPDGTAARCSFCHAPAVAEGWGWHRLWGRLPVFPRIFRYCREHDPGQPEDGE
jgi:hypothetical protein